MIRAEQVLGVDDGDHGAAVCALAVVGDNLAAADKGDLGHALQVQPLLNVVALGVGRLAALPLLGTVHVDGAWGVVGRGKERGRGDGSFW